MYIYGCVSEEHRSTSWRLSATYQLRAYNRYRQEGCPHLHAAALTPASLCSSALTTNGRTPASSTCHAPRVSDICYCFTAVQPVTRCAPPASGWPRGRCTRQPGPRARLPRASCATVRCCWCWRDSRGGAQWHRPRMQPSAAPQTPPPNALRRHGRGGWRVTMLTRCMDAARNL